MTKDFSEDRPDDYTLDTFHSPQPETEWQCTVCGRVDTDVDTIKKCCSKFSKSYRKYSPEPGDLSRFVYPETLHDSIIERCEAVRHAIQDDQDKHPLQCAEEEMLSAVSIQNEPGNSEAFSLFCHLVWLQGFGVIPGYPQYTNTTTSLSIDEFCTQADGVSGAVSASDITDSNLITTDRVYRSKVHSVTDLFWSETDLVPVSKSGPWKWKTFTSTSFPDSGYEETTETDEIEFTTVSNEYRDSEYENTAIYGNSAAHNVVVAEACQWLEQHPAISWMCAPYVLPAFRGVLEKNGYAPSDPCADPLWMFDFAGFDAQQYGLLGVVVDGESADEVFDRIKLIDANDIFGVVVMENRDAAHKFMRQAAAEGWVTDDISVEQYERRPNMSVVSTEIASDIDLFSQIRFVTRKQLIDDVLDPVTLFSNDSGEKHD